MHLHKISTAGMNSHFRGRQLEDQPSMPGVHGTKTEDILKKCAIRFGFFAVEQKVHAVNHAQSVTPVLWKNP